MQGFVPLPRLSIGIETKRQGSESAPDPRIPRRSVTGRSNSRTSTTNTTASTSSTSSKTRPYEAKNVNLNSPMFFYADGSYQAEEIVINKVGKDT